MELGEREEVEGIERTNSGLEEMERVGVHVRNKYAKMNL